MQYDADQPLRGEAEHQADDKERDVADPAGERGHRSGGDRDTDHCAEREAQSGKGRQEEEDGRAGEGRTRDGESHTELSARDKPQRPGVRHRIAEQRLHQCTGDSQRAARHDRG